MIENNKQFIRQRAEVILSVKNARTSEDLQLFSPAEIKNIVHELEVHQLELEMQNEELQRIQLELSSTKKRYFDLYDMAPIGYCTVSTKGLIQEVNLAVSNLLGVERDKLIKRPITHFIFKEDQDIYYKYRKIFFISEEQHVCELRMVKNDGTPFWAHLTATLDTNASDTAVFRLVIIDMSESKKREEKLELEASVFEHSGEGIVITVADGTICDVNESFTRITGYSKDEVIGKNPNILNSGRQNKEFYIDMWNKLLEKGSWSGEVWNKHKNGQVYVEKIIISAVYDNSRKVEHYVALFSDITDIKEYQQKLESIAHYDVLTGLPNRIMFAERLAQGMALTQRHNKHLAVIYLDLDGFKEINDNYGHDVGDRLLTKLATVMKQALREEDTLARIGGDEFVAVLFDLSDIESSLSMISRLLDSAAKNVQIGNLSVQVSASIGVAFYPQSEEVDADQLLRQADQAMYEAKLSGKNRYHIFNAEQNNLIHERFEGIKRLDEALNTNEFVLYYQPKVNMRTGEVLGVEALIRWQHPQKGLLEPSSFLPIIEGHSLSIGVGEWVINQVLSQIELWQKQGISMPISVNMCTLELLEENFVKRLESILAQHSTVEPSLLGIEVFETAKLEEIARAKIVMHQCRNLGILFSLDDFGTGYSSLTYLKRLPIKYIKIDQSFVIDMLDNPNDLSILDGVLSIAEAFNRSVIAEGVETLEHGRILMQLGCELGQGNVIAAPMPNNELINWLNVWKPDSSWSTQHLMNKDQHNIFFAKVELRAWIAKIKAILKDEILYDAEFTELHKCSFGKWLDKSGKDYLNTKYKEVYLMHKSIHAFAEKLLQLHSLGYKEEALEGVDELHEKRDNLLDELNKIE